MAVGIRLHDGPHLRRSRDLSEPGGVPAERARSTVISDRLTRESGRQRLDDVAGDQARLAVALGGDLGGDPAGGGGARGRGAGLHPLGEKRRIALVAGSAAAVNCLLEQRIDALMARTRARPLPTGQINSVEALAFAVSIGATGLALLYELVNPLTMWLSLGTFAGYAFIYTVILKPRTPQNIVIGGAAGAMPPVLGWAAVTGEVTADALLLFLIIFVDPAALLGARAVSQEGVCEGGRADVAGNAR